MSGRFHRKNGPASISWYPNGQKEFEIYYIDGKCHREDGPAYILWYSNGQITYEEYYINGFSKPIKYFLEQGLKMNKCKRCKATYLER